MPRTNSLARIALALGLVIVSQPLWAARYRVTVEGQLQKLNSSPSIFGLSASSIPVHFTFNVDTGLAPVATLPAGTVVGSNNETIPTDVQLISKNAITDFQFTVGTGSWGATDLITRGFDTGEQFDVLLWGDLVDGATPGIYVLATNASGDLQVGLYNCSPFSVCSFQNAGIAYSGGDQGAGSIVNIVATVTALSQTPAEQIADVITVLDTFPALPAGTKNSLAASLGGALDKLDPTTGVDIPAAKGKLGAFINKVQAQSGKKLTAQQANQLIATANAIIGSL